MDDLKGQKTLILSEKSPDILREKVRSYFHKTYSIDERLYDILADDDAFYLRADPLRHPLVFYLGHTAVFYMNKLNIARIVEQRINPSFESMFAVGVDEMSWDDLNMAHYNWPDIPKVKEYRHLVRDFVDSLISELPLTDEGIIWDSPWWAIVMGIEHQRIHLETSSVLIRQLPFEKVKQLDFWSICPDSGAAPANSLLPVQGGEVILGKHRTDPLYGWDNEYGSKSFKVEDFLASKYLVSNEEFLEFVQTGAYHIQRYWAEEAWAWKQYQGAEHPRFWIKAADGTFSLRTIASVVPMPWNHPVEVNYLEAKAFCNWKAEQLGMPIRLPSEAEWYCLRDRHVHTDQAYWDKAPANINLEYWASACPIDRFAFGEFFDIIGNVWQWTETPICGFPGFKVHPYYDDFSVPTFDGRHNLIKGGSFISTGNEAIRDSRYAFRRHFYQHAGFRYISSDAVLETENDLYENDPEIVPWCDLDWDSEFHKWLMEAIKQHFAKRGRALHLGCKTGRISFELAAYYDHVTGLDSTARLIQLGTKMKEDGFIRYETREEGEIFQTFEHSLAECKLESSAGRVEFWQADSSNLLAKFSAYDLVLAVNALEQSLNPQSLLQSIHQRMNPQSILIVADAYDWQSVKPLGGIRKDGEPYSSFEALKDILKDNFTLLEEPIDIWQPIRHTKRKYHSKLLQVSVWRLKS